MTTIKKLPIKKLIRPIKIIIDITIYSYWDKANGNNYCSGRAVVNNNYDNTIYYPFQYNNSEQANKEILTKVISTFKGLDKVINLHYTSQALAQGVLVYTRVIEVNQRVCKQYGEQL